MNERVKIYTCVGEWGWGVEGKQVGSMDEESQVHRHAGWKHGMKSHKSEVTIT